MFPLHDRVRRRICIAGFFALAVAPTVAVLGLALAWRLPSHVRAEAERLGRQLGMDVSLTGVEHPLPGVIRYRGLDLSSPETGRTVAHCLWLEAQNRMLADPQGKLRPTLVLRAWQPEVDVAEMAELGQLANGAIRLRLGNSRCDVQLERRADPTQDGRRRPDAHRRPRHRADDHGRHPGGAPFPARRQRDGRAGQAIVSAETAKPNRRPTGSKSTPAAARCPATCSRWPSRRCDRSAPVRDFAAASTQPSSPKAGRARSRANSPTSNSIDW